jgi:AcrR family transcriptional regulator
MARQRILETAKEAFLQSGYEGIRIEDITKAAGLSRSSFYVYFPSKRDVLLALGVNSVEAGAKNREALRAVTSASDTAGLRAFVEVMMDFLDQYGAFGRVWRQATASDPELPDLREQGLRATLRTAREFGRQLDRLRGRPGGDVGVQGLALWAMIEGLWFHVESHPTSYGREVCINGLVESMSRLIS